MGDTNWMSCSSVASSSDSDGLSEISLSEAWSNEGSQRYSLTSRFPTSCDSRDTEETESFLTGNIEDLHFVKQESKSLNLVSAMRDKLRNMFPWSSRYPGNNPGTDLSYNNETYCDMMGPYYNGLDPCGIKQHNKHSVNSRSCSVQKKPVSRKFRTAKSELTYEAITQEALGYTADCCVTQDTFHDAGVKRFPHTHMDAYQNRQDGIDTDSLYTITKDRIACPIGPHCLETILEIANQAKLVSRSMGEAFNFAYAEFLKINKIDDMQTSKKPDQQEVIHQEQICGEDLFLFSKLAMTREVVIEKRVGEALGVMIVESGWGSLLPTVVLASMSPKGAAARSGKLNIGDNILAINGHSLVGLEFSVCKKLVQKTKWDPLVRLSVVSCPLTTEACIRRPDVNYQLGISVQDGVICSLLRGGIAEKGGVRVGHRIMEVNGQCVIGERHERIVTILGAAVGMIWMRTIPNTLFCLLTGQEVPRYI